MSNKLSSRQVGAVGVARVTGALLRCGYNVLTPYEDFAGYDVVAERDNKFYRIQVKTAQVMEPNRSRYRFTTASGSEIKWLIVGVDYVAWVKKNQKIVEKLTIRSMIRKFNDDISKANKSWRN